VAHDSFPRRSGFGGLNTGGKRDDGASQVREARLHSTLYNEDLACVTRSASHSARCRGAMLRGGADRFSVTESTASELASSRSYTSETIRSMLRGTC
jgi:hypothetical protein